MFFVFFLHTIRDVLWAATWREVSLSGASSKQQQQQDKVARCKEVCKSNKTRATKKPDIFLPAYFFFFLLTLNKRRSSLWCPRCERNDLQQRRGQHTKSSLMSVQSSGSLEGTPSLVPAHHVPNTDCFTSGIPRQWWRPGKVSSNIPPFHDAMCLLYPRVLPVMRENEPFAHKKVLIAAS